jgi:hypothetical protein
VLLVAAGARIALDAGTHGYYTPGLLLGALLWDLVGARRPVPVLTILGYGGLNLVPLLVSHGYLRGEARFGAVLVLLAVALVAPARWCWQPGLPARQPRVLAVLPEAGRTEAALPVGQA